MSKNIKDLGFLFDDEDTDGFADGINVSEYDSLTIQIVTTNTPDGAIYIWGSGSIGVPAWDSLDIDNIAEKKFITSQDTEAKINGSTGITAPGNIIKEYLIDVTGINWISSELSGNSTGEWSLNIIGINNNY